MSDQLKRCHACGEVLPVSSFSSDRKRKDGLNDKCKACQAKYSKEYRDSHKELLRESKKRSYEKNKTRILDDYRKRRAGAGYAERDRERHILKTYGLSMLQVEELLLTQEGKCPICLCTLSTEQGSRDILHIDHDHKTGKIRGLLCYACNAGLGQFKDSSSSMRRVANRLRKVIITTIAS
jgi:DNA-directed RNA polymerase subunit M/transcription elongation factor TFIIS